MSMEFNCFFYQTEMMQLFARGKRKEFLRLWTEYLSPGVRDSDPVSQKLEFYAMVYFATYALRQGKEVILSRCKISSHKVILAMLEKSLSICN